MISEADRQEFIDLLEHVGSHLSGRRVEVDIGSLTDKRKAGAMTRYGNTARIEIAPALGAKFLGVYLHEVAHVKLDWSQLVDLKANPGYQEPPPIFQFQQIQRESDYNLMEGKANMQSIEWRLWAMEHADSYNPVDMLISLLEYPNDQE